MDGKVEFEFEFQARAEAGPKMNLSQREGERDLSKVAASAARAE